MCVQCAAAAAVTVGSASGIRAWLGARFALSIGARRMRWVTGVLMGAAVLASGLVVGGSG